MTRGGVLDRDATEPPPARSRTSSPSGGPVLPYAGFFLAEAVLLGLLRWWQPRFFYIDDKQAQYLPMWHWLGARTGVGGQPLMNPDMGSAGALVGDLQYGVLDPFHWLLARALTGMDGLNAAGWGLHVLAATVLGLGVVALGRHYGVAAAWCVAAAVGAANSGFFFWFAASWWPAAWGTALLPWLWWGLASHRRTAVLVAGVSAYLLGTSGYPYALPFAGVVVVGVLAEVVVRHGWHGVVGRAVVARALAAAGGLALAAPGLLAASALAPYTQRATISSGPLDSTGDFVPNLLDVLVGGPTTTPQVQGWWGTVIPCAAMATAWFALPVLAMVDLRAGGGLRALVGRPGVLTAGLLSLAGVVATQTPTIVASLRFPFRYATVVQVFLPLLVVLLVAACGVRVSRGRVVAALLVLTAQGLLATSRSPALVAWHLGAVVLGAVFLLAFAAASSPARRPRRRGLPVLLLVVATALAPLTSVAAAVAANDRFAATDGRDATGLPADALYNGDWWPASLTGFREAAVEPGLRATVVQWAGSGPDRGLASGVPVGNGALFSDMQVSFGYTSVGQRGWSDRWCQNYLGEVGFCGDAVPRLLDTVPGTDLSWFEATSQNTLLVSTNAPAELTASLGDRWRDAGVRGGFRVFDRIDPMPGRITWTGSAVQDVQADEVDYDAESYAMSWSAAGDHRVVTRIPWWPGYEVTVDGVQVPVVALDDTVVAFDLPEGAGSGRVQISFRPPGLTLGLVAAGFGAALLAAGLVVGLLPGSARGRPRRSPPVAAGR